MLALAVLGEYWPSVVFVRVKILQRALGWSGVIFCIHLSNFGSLPIPPTSSQRIIRVGFNTNWLKPNENWTHNDPLRYSEKKVTNGLPTYELRPQLYMVS